MKQIIALAILFIATTAAAQQGPTYSALLDHLAGRWVMTGTIRNEAVTHDVTAEWVLEHRYLRVHEVSREKNKDGSRRYEAMIFIAWNEPTKQYSCVWLDVYGGLTAESIGVAAATDSSLPFIFKDAKGEVSFTNDFAYDAKTDTWQWFLDNVKNGLHVPFGRVKLRRTR